MPVNEPLDLAELRSTLDNQGAPWTMAYTTMTALTESERVIRLGVPPTPGLDIEELEEGRDETARAVRAAKAEAVGAPASFDLRKVNGHDYSTPVQDQGQCGSCVAFGTAAAMEHVTRFTRNAPQLAVDLSEAHLFYCYAYTDGYRCTSGWWPHLALAAARDTGVTVEIYYPYTDSQQTCTGLNADWPNRVVKATAFEKINGNAAKMKEYIATKGSVIACLDVYQDFFSYRSGVYRHISGNYAGGHCVTLIGYDDSEGCWIAKNSWGTGWGSNGLFMIAYGECRIETYETFGISGTTVKSWLPDQRISGLWSNEHDANAWAYGSQRGWLKIDGGNTVTTHAMLSQLAAAKAVDRPVGLYENNGTITQIYAW